MAYSDWLWWCQNWPGPLESRRGRWCDRCLRYYREWLAGKDFDECVRRYREERVPGEQTPEEIRERRRLVSNLRLVR